MIRKIRWSKMAPLLDLRRNKGQPQFRVIVGLGNPGQQYSQSRHNVGFWVVDRVAEDHSITLFRRQRLALMGEGIIEDHRVVIAKPRTFMNDSGRAVKYLLARYKISPKELLVVHDDLALPLGKVRLRTKGSAGGHNGMGSIIEAAGTQDIPRLRLGIGQPPTGSDQVQYVLGSMSDVERKRADIAIEKAVQGVAIFLSEGITVAMNEVN